VQQIFQFFIIDFVVILKRSDVLIYLLELLRSPPSQLIGVHVHFGLKDVEVVLSVDDGQVEPRESRRVFANVYHHVDVAFEVVLLEHFVPAQVRVNAGV